MFVEITQKNQLESFIKERSAALVYFSTDECNVCKVLKPKIQELIVGNFPQIALVYININKAPDIAAHYRVFVAPTLVIFFEDRELLRKSRSFGIYELEQELNRPYHLLFS
ncbi:thioredoxin family protein [Sunxiuqinia sp. A32]|uniref:thioredoxin family protein n=1 Tax=Sunxiuqinia sp. A32 TaxID=3461496 RepID=UPI004045FDDB